MVSLYALWLPIVVASVLVFVASAIIHMGPFWHRSDYPKLPNEDGVRNALRPFGLAPGDYMVPRATSSKDMRAPEFIAKLQEGPVAIFTVMPSRPMSMGRNLTQWFVYVLIVSWFAAYITSRALPAGADYLRVFQLAGASAFIGYALGLAQMSIWYGRSWSLTIKELVDGLIYGALTAGVFGWLWPGT